jgi:hypothetical protein
MAFGPGYDSQEMIFSLRAAFRLSDLQGSRWRVVSEVGSTILESEDIFSTSKYIHNTIDRSKRGHSPCGYTGEDLFGILRIGLSPV